LKAFLGGHLAMAAVHRVWYRRLRGGEWRERNGRGGLG